MVTDQQRAGRSHWAVPVLVTLGVIVSLACDILFLVGSGGVDGGDWAEFVQQPVRLLHGDVPYRDFFLFYPPGHLLVPAAVYALFGTRLLAIGLCLAFTKAVIVGLALLIWPPSRHRLLGTTAMLVPVAIFSLGDEQLLKYLCLVGIVLVLSRAVERPTMVYAGILGLLAGVAGTVRAEMGPILSVSILAAIWAWGSFAPGKRAKGLLSGLPAYLVGFCLPCAAVLVYAAGNGALPQMVYALTTASARHLAHMGLPYFAYAFAGANPIAGALKVAVFLSPFVLLITGVFAYGDVHRTRAVQARSFGGLFLFWLCYGALLMPRLFTRSDIPHVVDATRPLFVALAFALVHLWSMEDRSWRRPAALALLLFAFLPSLGLRADEILERVTAARASDRFVPIDSPASAGLPAPSRRAEPVNATLRYVSEHTKPGDPILVTSFHAPPFYLLCDRPNPCRFDSFLPGFLSPGEEQQLVAQLRSDPPEVVVHRRGERVDTSEDRKFENYAPMLNGFIWGEYDVALEFDGWVILQHRRVAGHAR